MCIPYTLSFEMLFVLRVSFLGPWLPELGISLHWLSTAWAQLAGARSLSLSRKTEKEQCDSGLRRWISGTKQKASDEWKYPDPGEQAELSCSGKVSNVGLAVWRLRPNCNWKTFLLVLGFGPSTDDAGNRETGSTEGPWQRVQWPVKHFYCQWCSDNYMSCRSNQGRLFPSGGWKLCFVLVLLGGGGGGRRGAGRKGEQYDIPQYGIAANLSVCSSVFCLSHFDSRYSDTTSEVEWKEKLVNGDICGVVTDAREDVGGRKRFSTTTLHMWKAQLNRQDLVNSSYVYSRRLFLCAGCTHEELLEFFFFPLCIRNQCLFAVTDSEHSFWLFYKEFPNSLTGPEFSYSFNKTYRDGVPEIGEIFSIVSLYLW